MPGLRSQVARSEVPGLLHLRLRHSVRDLHCSADDREQNLHYSEARVTDMHSVGYTCVYVGYTCNRHTRTCMSIPVHNFEILIALKF